MSEKRKLRISPAVAAFVRSGLSSEDKLRGLKAAAAMTPVDHGTLLFCLMRDADAPVKDAGTAAFSTLSEELLLSCIAEPGIHPAILDAISRFHHGKPTVVSALLRCPALTREAGAFLGKVAVMNASDLAGETDASESDSDAEPVGDLDELNGLDEPPGEDLAERVPDTGPPGDDDEVAESEPGEEDDEHFSKYKLIQMMGIGEKIKMALTGDKEWRSILVNDTNKLVSSSVIKNPRITDGEILRIIKVGVQNDEIIRLICDNREWVKNPLIRKALVDCPKTPLPNALRYLASLGDKEIAAYAKSRNISSVISTQAKRIILAKKR
jgi:hypothetical protein